jgi:hypothetical protein
MVEERFETERLARRQSRFELARVCGECIAWCVAGLGCMGLAFHSTDQLTGKIYYYLAFVVNYGGMTISLACAYRRGEERGDW